MKLNLSFISVIFALFVSMTLFAGDKPTTYQDNHNLNLRDKGPSGGWIFYINPKADKDGWKYLEAAPTDAVYSDKTTFQWGEGIFAQEAATAAKEYSVTVDGVTYDDWFLPPKHVLVFMLKNLHGRRQRVGNFDSNFYWSSTRGNTMDKAWAVHPYNASAGEYPKSGDHLVRPVRKF